jgi:hypothetical protein
MRVQQFHAAGRLLAEYETSTHSLGIWPGTTSRRRVTRKFKAGAYAITWTHAPRLEFWTIFARTAWPEGIMPEGIIRLSLIERQK